MENKDFDGHLDLQRKYVTQEVIQLVTKDLEILRFSKPNDNVRLG
jgi:hypothetical protein